MTKKFVVDNAIVPSGVFGEFQPEGNPPGEISFTNKSDVTGVIEVLGSNDGVNWCNIKKFKVRSDETKMKKSKIPPYMKFHNRGAAFGPATLIVVNAD